MSDCSTRAMKTKKRRKCETCGHACYAIHDVICPFARYEGQEPEEDGRYRQCAVSNACGRYFERPGTLSQRYDRLVELAHDIGVWLFFEVETDPGHVIVEDDQANARDFRERLEVLGIKVAAM